MNDKTQPYPQPPLSIEEFQREQAQSRIDELRAIIESRDIIIEDLRSTVSQLRDKAKPPLGNTPKHLLETDSPTENAILALSEIDDVLQRRGIDNKACLNALAYHFSERAKRRT